jgi:hypothetical protein
VIFLQKNHQAILQLNPLRLCRMKGMQRRNGNLSPRLRLLCAGRNPGNKQNKS